MIYQLTYTSEAIKTLADDDIYAILKSSEQNNHQLKISGCLLLYNQKFYQILEGNETTVLALYEQIKRDPRHYNVTLTATSYAKEPLYKDWGMIFQDVNTSTTDPEDVQQFERTLLMLESLTEKTTESEIWFWREIKKELVTKKVITH